MPCGAIVAYIDLETNSLDVLSGGKIVEIGALVDGARTTFSTVVHPGRDALLDDVSVHGIPHEELLLGPSFAEAFARLVQFLRYASLSVLESDDDDSEDSQPAAAVMKQDLQVCLVAHNGGSFDFPFLLGECLRAGVGPAAMSSYIYVDTLDVLRATDLECKKLQCALRACCGPPTALRAHRALDDCFALEAVVRNVSASFGIKPWALLSRFAFRLDEASAIAQMNALIA